MKKIIAVIIIAVVIFAGTFIMGNTKDGEPTIKSVVLHEELNGTEVFLVR